MHDHLTHLLANSTQVYPKTAEDAVLQVARGAVFVVDILTNKDSPLVMILEEATPRNILLGTKMHNGWDNAVIMERGSKFNESYTCKQTFTNNEHHLEKGAKGKVVASCSFAEGPHKKFANNRLLGTCNILQEQIEGCLDDPSYLPDGLLSLTVKSMIGSNCSFSFILEVRRNDAVIDETAIPDLKGCFTPSGVLPRPVLLTVRKELAGRWGVMDSSMSDVVASGPGNDILDIADGAKAMAEKLVETASGETVEEQCGEQGGPAVGGASDEEEADLSQKVEISGQVSKSAKKKQKKKMKKEKNRDIKRKLAESESQSVKSDGPAGEGGRDLGGSEGSEEVSHKCPRVSEAEVNASV